MRVKGKQEPVRIFEPMEPGEPGVPGADELERYHQALAHYRAREWQPADEALASLASAAPHCPLYALYRRRIADFRRAPPPADWQGIEVFSEK